MEKRGRREGVGQAANHTAWSGQNQYKAGRNFVTFFHQLYVTIFLLLLVRFFLFRTVAKKCDKRKWKRIEKLYTYTNHSRISIDR